MSKSSGVLITGQSGLLGLGLLKKIPNKFHVIQTHHEVESGNDSLYLDITNKKSIDRVFSKNNFEVVIHTASIGNVDACEKDKDNAFKVNIIGTRNIINACEKYNKRLFFISSNAVFDGESPPYSEKDQKNPVNYYGETKSISEDDVLKSKTKNTIVRLVLMYGWNGQQSRQNPVTWLLDKLDRGEEIYLVNDTYVNPVYNLQAADAIWKLVMANKTGIYHIAGKTSVNRYEFGLNIAQVFGKDSAKIHSVDSSYFPSIAKRMPNTTYSLKKIIRDIGYRPLSIKSGLKKMREEKQ